MAFEEGRIEFYLRNGSLCINLDDVEQPITIWMRSRGFSMIETLNTIRGYVYSKGIQLYTGPTLQPVMFNSAISDEDGWNSDTLFFLSALCKERVTHFPDAPKGHIYNGMYCAGENDIWTPVENITNVVLAAAQKYGIPLSEFPGLDTANAPGEYIVGLKA